MWSLLPDFDISATSGGVESMLIELEETNLAGRQQSLVGSMFLQPKSVAVGLAYNAPRFTGRWLSLVAESSIIFNRESSSRRVTFSVRPSVQGRSNPTAARPLM